MKRSIGYALLFLSLLLIVLVGFGSFWLLRDLPSLDELPLAFHSPSVRIVDRNGRLLYEVLHEMGGRHAILPIASFPIFLRQATIATEDRSFYSNPGVDAVGIARAFWINIRASLEKREMETLAGGSTITQQVVRNLLFSPEERGERSLRRKLREAFLAWQVTRRLSKDEILALYLNQTYYGSLTYGAEAAAQTFFGKSVSELDLAESALLAGLPQAPSLYNPFIDLEAAQERQRVVLGLMHEAGFIDDEQLLLAEREKLVLAFTPYPFLAPHFVMMVRAQLDTLYTPEQIYESGGMLVRTTLDLDWQGHAERAIERQLEALQKSEDGLGHNVNSAALVALEPHTGQILALVGSPDFGDSVYSGAINMAIAPRQPGSALKPILYVAALDPFGPLRWTAATMLLDVSTTFLTGDGQAYTPANYDLSQHGPVSLRQALGSSLNIPAVFALNEVGLDALVAQATKMGITTLKDPQRYDLSLALGGGEVSLLELTAAYAVFANGGCRVTPFSILEVSDLGGRVLFAAPSVESLRVLDERLAWLISDILSDNDARLLGFSPNSALQIGRPAAAKTGTTSNFHDNWTIGYTPDLAVGVWVGNTNYEPMREVDGLSGAAPIWHHFIRTVLTGRLPEPFIRPPGIMQVQVCALSGLLPSAACPYHRWEWFIEGTQPTDYDPICQLVQIDAGSGRLADENTPPERRRTQTVLDLPAEAQPWARSNGITLLSDLLAASSISIDRAGLLMLTPASGSVYRLDAHFDRDSQRLRMEAVAGGGWEEVSLWVDGELLATFEKPPYQAWWPLSSGRHKAWAEGVRADGERLVSEAVQFVVEE